MKPITRSQKKQATIDITKWFKKRKDIVCKGIIEEIEEKEIFIPSRGKLEISVNLKLNVDVTNSFNKLQIIVRNIEGYYEKDYLISNK